MATCESTTEIQDMNSPVTDVPVQEAPQAHDDPAKLQRKLTFKDRFPNGISWPTTLWFAGMHAGAIAGLFFFSWQGVLIFFALHFVTACIGVTLGYHRLLTHGSFVTYKPVKYFLSLCGMLSAEGSPIFWVATHRKHHAHSDLPEDPHSPLHGFMWAHILWLHPKHTAEELNSIFQRWAPDLYKDPVQRFFHNFFPVVPIATGIALYLVGEYLIGGLGISLVLWGLCARVVAVYHSTWFVNSATHVWGYRNYTTKDESRNNWWVAIISYGEGWHNNHHAYQRLARHGHRWWEIDVTYAMIWIMKMMGLAWKVQDKLPGQH